MGASGVWWQSNTVEEEDGAPYNDSESSNIEGIIGRDVQLAHSIPSNTRQQHIQVILTCPVYSVLVWQYKNYVSDNAMENFQKSFQKLLLCTGDVHKDHTDLLDSEGGHARFWLWTACPLKQDIWILNCETTPKTFIYLLTSISSNGAKKQKGCLGFYRVYRSQSN